jgi:hypothetical protein
MRTEDELTAAVRKFVGQVSHWTPSRWAASSPSGATRADQVFDLVQRLAAMTTPRRVPRLDNDLALPDQLRVVAADVLADAPTRAPEAAEAIRSTQRTL